MEVVAEAFHHNPTIVKAPDGTLLMVSIGNGTGGSGPIPPPPKQNNCTAPTGADSEVLNAMARDDSLGDPLMGGVITTLHSKSVKGPWTQLPGVAVEPGAPGSWDDFLTKCACVLCCC